MKEITSNSITKSNRAVINKTASSNVRLILLLKVGWYYDN